MSKPNAGSEWSSAKFRKDSESLADIFGEETADDSESLADIFGEETADDSESLADIFGEETADVQNTSNTVIGTVPVPATEISAIEVGARKPAHVDALNTGKPLGGVVYGRPVLGKKQVANVRNVDRQAGVATTMLNLPKASSPSLWSTVENVLNIVSQEDTLQSIANNLVITQDTVVHAAQLESLSQALRPVLAGRGVNLGKDDDIANVISVVCDELSGISVLGGLYRDALIDEILVDRWDIVSVEVGGTLVETKISFKSPDHAASIARVLAQKVSSRAVSNSIPLVSAELPGARLTVAYGSVVKGGLSITVRKFRKLLNLEDLLDVQSLSRDVADFLQDCVQCKAGILVSGSTGSGKTTIINILSNFIPDTERVITIEDAFELKLANKHVVSLQTKEAASMDDAIEVTLADLLRNTLRMRPDRIIVGEIREGLGATVMLDAASTGHEGTMTTIHANDVRSAVNERLPALIRQVRSGDSISVLRSIAGSFDVVLQVNRGKKGLRYISNVSAIGDVDYTCDMLEVSPIFVGEQDDEGAPEFTRVPVGADTSLGKRLKDYGKTEWLQ